MKRIIAICRARCVARRGRVRRRHLVGAPVRRCARERARRNRLHLPDAPGLPQRPSRRLPDAAACVSSAVRADGTTGGDGAAGAPPHGSVQVSPERQQAIGVRVGVVSRAAGTRLLRTTGRVVADENRTYPIVAAVSGWIRNVENVTTGDTVKKDQVLASLFAPDAQFETAQQSYYAGLEMLYRTASAQPQVPSHDSRSAVEEVERLADGLRSLGVSNSQMRQLATRREIVHDIRVESPVDGVVLKRGVTSGLRFDRGFEFYRIADLNRVWILADVYRDQLPFIRRGASARITTAEESHALSATVSPSEPIFDEATLTLKVRLEAANPRRALKPGMFVDVEFPVDLPRGARRAGGCDRGLRAAQDGVRRVRRRALRAAAGRDGLAHR